MQNENASATSSKVPHSVQDNDLSERSWLRPVRMTLQNKWLRPACSFCNSAAENNEQGNHKDDCQQHWQQAAIVRPVHLGPASTPHIFVLGLHHHACHPLSGMQHGEPDIWEKRTH